MGTLYVSSSHHKKDIEINIISDSESLQERRVEKNIRTGLLNMMMTYKTKE